jgi:hypothetical protein
MYPRSCPPGTLAAYGHPGVRRVLKRSECYEHDWYLTNSDRYGQYVPDTTHPFVALGPPG